MRFIREEDQQECYGDMTVEAFVLGNPSIAALACSIERGVSRETFFLQEALFR